MHTTILTPAASVSKSYAEPRLHLSLASNGEEIAQAQRLRWEVFAEEQGARLAGNGLDQDDFDPWCDHLLVRDLSTDSVVGTYRILPPHRAYLLGRCYAETEFDLTPLEPLRSTMVELGRSCVHPDYRSGAVINLLWAGLARYMQKGGYQYLIGCPSISMADGGQLAASVYATLQAQHACPDALRTRPHCRLPLEAFTHAPDPALPPLIKGYARLGAWVCAEPAWDPDFNTADLLMLLPLARVAPRHLDRLLRCAA